MPGSGGQTCGMNSRRDPSAGAIPLRHTPADDQGSAADRPSALSAALRSETVMDGAADRDESRVAEIVSSQSPRCAQHVGLPPRPARHSSRRSTPSLPAAHRGLRSASPVTAEAWRRRGGAQRPEESRRGTQRAPAVGGCEARRRHCPPWHSEMSQVRGHLLQVDVVIRSHVISCAGHRDAAQELRERGAPPVPKTEPNDGRGLGHGRHSGTTAGAVRRTPVGLEPRRRRRKGTHSPHGAAKTRPRTP